MTVVQLYLSTQKDGAKPSNELLNFGIKCKYQILNMQIKHTP